jgi:hypothetical protein
MRALTRSGAGGPLASVEEAELRRSRAVGVLASWVAAMLDGLLRPGEDPIQ